jgi:hypothetical protein
MTANNLAYELIINKSSPFSKNLQVSDLDAKLVSFSKQPLNFDTHLLPPDNTLKNTSNFSKIKQVTLRSKQYRYPMAITN